MIQKFSPFLCFDGRAEEAAELDTSTSKRSWKGKIIRCRQGRPSPKGSMMPVAFELEGKPSTALNGGPYLRFTGAIPFVVRCKSQKKVASYWEKLSNGGK